MSDIKDSSDAKRCVRCPAPFEVIGKKAHNLNTCKEGHGPSDCWLETKLEGKKEDKPANYEDAEALLELIVIDPKIGKFKGYDVSKWLLENARTMVYDKRGNKKNASGAASQAAVSTTPKGKKTALAAPKTASVVTNATPSSKKEASTVQTAPTPEPSNMPSHAGAGTTDAPLALRPAQSTTPAHSSGVASSGSTGTMSTINSPQSATPAGSTDAFGNPQTAATGSTGTRPGQGSSGPLKRLDEAATGKGKEVAETDKLKGQLGSTKSLDILDANSHTNVITNYIRVKSLPKKVYKYSLTWPQVSQAGQPPADMDRSQKRLAFAGLRNMLPLSARNDWAHTDHFIIWSITPLWAHTAVDQVQVTAQIAFKKLSGRDVTINGVEFKFVGTLDFHLPGSTTPNLQVLVDTPQAQFDQRLASDHKTALNALISKHADERNNSIMLAGPNKFFMMNSVLDFNMLEAHRGYFTSVRPGTSQVLLNIGYSTGAFYRRVTVADFLRELGKHDYREYGFDDDARPQKLLRGRTVRIIYTRPQQQGATFDQNDENNRRRVISSFGKPPKKQMFDHNGTSISVFHYFRNILGLPAPAPDLPCVNVGVKPTTNPNTAGKQIWIPADYLMIEPGQPFGRRLADVHMSSMIKVALRSPAWNQELLVDEGLRALMPAQTSLSNLGLNMEPRLLSIPATFLFPPAIFYQAGFKAKVQQASWNLRDRDDQGAKNSQTAGKAADPKFYVPSKESRPLYVLDFRWQTLGGENLSWLGPALAERLRDHGMSISSETSHYWTYYDKPGAKKLAEMNDDDLAEIVEKALQKLPKNMVCLVILDVRSTEVYAKIKRIFDQTHGIHTVCLTSGKLVKGKYELSKAEMAQTFSNLALKFNLKLGGQNFAVMHKVAQKFESGFASIADDTMVVGADVSHAPSSMANCPSVAAIVASNSSSFDHFPGSMRLQASKQEFIEHLQEMMVERLREYGTKRLKLPKHILFYRDGVGEDMYERVRREEIKKIHDAFDQYRKGCPQKDHPDVKLTFVIVGKRHNTRFFAQTENDVVRKGFNANVKPGLIVDKHITQPKFNGDPTFDFFLLSHQAITGTARPAHYVVLETGGLSKQAIQTLTFRFCYNFARATKGVSYVAPAYYADRLCERGALYLKKFTGQREAVDFGMNATELSMNKVDGQKAYERRIAEYISAQKEWNPKFGKRNNPWHENMDKVMFWL